VIPRILTRGKLFAAIIAALFLMAAYPALAATEPPTAGGVLPPLTLEVPKDTSARNYLGLKDTANFTVPEIRAQVVIIEIFNMY
jgi:hypothetical protein